jgi:hypothetical protein
MQKISDAELMKFEKMVRFFAYKFKVGGGMTGVEDLYANGMYWTWEGLLLAGTHADLKTKVSVRKFVRRYVRDKMVTHLREHRRTQYDSKNLRKLHELAQRAGLSRWSSHLSLHTKPSDELSDERMRLAQARQYYPLRVDISQLQNVLIAKTAEVKKVMSVKDLFARAGLNAVELFAVEAIELKGWTQAQVSKELKIKPWQSYRAHRDGLARLRIYLEEVEDVHHADQVLLQD